MTAYRPVAEKLVAALGLEPAPVAVAFVDRAPEGVPVLDRAHPSACSLWRAAEAGLFFAPAAAHGNCPVGAFTMGFDLPEATAAELNRLVGAMVQSAYLKPDEAAAIPTVAGSAAGILYGPLADFLQAPDAVLVWLTPAQAMVWGEASGGAEWCGRPDGASGRPTCAAIPLALRENRPALSFGCMGMRVFTRIPDDRLLGVIPATRLDAFAEALRSAAAVNATMAAFYREREAALGAA